MYNYILDYIYNQNVNFDYKYNQTVPTYFNEFEINLTRIKTKGA